MDRQQARILENNGFAFGRVADLTPTPRAKFYSRDKNTGAVVEHNLPADPYSLNHYLRKGFVLNPNDLKPVAEVKAEQPPATSLSSKKRSNLLKEVNK